MAFDFAYKRKELSCYKMVLILVERPENEMLGNLDAQVAERRARYVLMDPTPLILPHCI
jgi:hypothetical protein